MRDNPSHELASAFDGYQGELPESLDRGAVRRMQFVANLLDESVRVPGTNYRVGLDPVLGVLPGAGDLLSGALSLYIVIESARLGVTYTTLLRMMANVSVDVVGGSVPVLGTLFDAGFKANKRNVAMAIKEIATEPPRDARRRSGDVTTIDVE